MQINLYGDQLFQSNCILQMSNYFNCMISWTGSRKPTKPHNQANQGKKNEEEEKKSLISQRARFRVL